MMGKIYIYVVVMIIAAGTGFAAPADQPQTGQKKCFNAAGSEVSCAGTGHDGEKKAGIAWPIPRFIDNRNGTVTDTLTGLIWLKNAGCTFGGANNYRAWTEALAAVNGLANGQCELTDGSTAGAWRLPNANELGSLVHAGYNEMTCSGSPCSANAAWLNTQGFSNVQARYYWSSTSYAGNISYAWLVDMFYGTVDYGHKTDSGYVWPVRSGQ